MENLYLIRWVIQKCFGWSYDKETLFQYGALGLLAAEKKYDKTKGKFKTYAWHKIRGAILDGIRKERPQGFTWIKVDTNPPEMLSFQTPVVEWTEFNLEEIIGGSEFEDRLATHQVVEFALSQLSQRDRRVIRWYFWDGFTQGEIGNKIGRTEGRVCQILQESLEHMRYKIDKMERLTN